MRSVRKWNPFYSRIEWDCTPFCSRTEWDSESNGWTEFLDSSQLLVLCAWLILAARCRETVFVGANEGHLSWKPILEGESWSDSLGTAKESAPAYIASLPDARSTEPRLSQLQPRHAMREHWRARRCTMAQALMSTYNHTGPLVLVPAVTTPGSWHIVLDCQGNRHDCLFQTATRANAIQLEVQIWRSLGSVWPLVMSESEANPSLG